MTDLLVARRPNKLVVEQFRPRFLERPDEDLELIFRTETENLRTSAGADWQAQQMGGTAGTAVANVIALAITTSLTPAAADQSIYSATSGVTTNEATDAVWNGLGRRAGVFAHTNGTAVYTIVKTAASGAVFTLAAGGSGTPPVTVYGAALFQSTTVTGSIMVFEANFTSATLVIGDSLAITWQISI